MSRIDEWNPVYPKQVGSPEPPPPAAKPPTSGAPHRPAPPAPPVQPAPSLVEEIYGKLLLMQPDPPIRVHFYLGEGLRWIRVGFDGDWPLTPRAIRDVGEVIQTCIAPPGPLYFHALRAHDMLFFLEGGKEESIGMPAACFGTPLDEVLQAWGLIRPAAPRNKSARRRAS